MLISDYLVETVCPQDGVVPHPHDCSRYIICNDKHAVDQRCEDGYQFDANHRKCVVGTTDVICYKPTEGNYLIFNCIFIHKKYQTQV